MGDLEVKVPCTAGKGGDVLTERQRCCDGLQALERLQQTPDRFNNVLMDIQMPIMDGIDASKRIRNELHLETLPIIALSADALTHREARRS